MKRLPFATTITDEGLVTRSVEINWLRVIAAIVVVLAAALVVRRFAAHRRGR